MVNIINEVILQMQGDEHTNEVDGGKEARLALEEISRGYQGKAAYSTKPIDQRGFYEFSSKIGIQYGTTFQLLEDIRWDGTDTATASIRAPATVHVDLFHPTVLDAALQLALVPLSKGISENIMARVPHRLRNAWLSARSWQTPSVNLLSTVRARAAQRDIESTTCVLDHDGQPLCVIKELLMTAVSQNHAVDDKPKMMLYGLAWKPQLSLLTPSQLQQACQADVTSTDSDDAVAAYYDKVESAFKLCLTKVLLELPATQRYNSPLYLQKYLSVAQNYVIEKGFDPSFCDTQLEALLQECTSFRPGWEIIPAVVRNMQPLVKLEVHALEILFQDALSEKYCSFMFDKVFDIRARQFIDLATHEHPCLRILEVGAGTGSMTRHVLSIIRDLEKRDGYERFLDYTYTDISSGFFSGAQEKFKEFEGRILFKKLDLECDAVGQGFESEGYDLVLAGSVLHATADITATMRNLHRILKPGGHLIYMELIPTFNPWVDLLWGLLPGWWLSKEEWRAKSPLLTEAQWDDVSRQAGFSGNDLVIRDHENDACHSWSMMISTAQSDNKGNGLPPDDPNIVLIVDPGESMQTAVAEQILQGRKGMITNLADLHGISWHESDIVISLVELGASLVADMTEKDFGTIKQLIQQARKVLWVTSASIGDTVYPSSQVAVGFLRTMQLEFPEKQLVLLAIETSREKLASKTCSE